MIRQLFTVGSGISLVMSLAMIAVWVRGFSIVDGLQAGRMYILLGNGNIYVERTEPGWGGRTRLDHFPADWKAMMEGPSPRSFVVYVRSPGHLGFLSGSGKDPVFGLSIGSADFPPVTYRFVLIPHWFIVTLFALLPSAWIGRHLISALGHPQQGLCPTCRYDLRASTGRCPECGTSIPRNAEERA